MPISNKKKIIFIHIPKNAGTSIIKSKELEFSEVQHRTYKFYKNYYKSQWNDFLKVAIVRNPWDRFVSCYNYAIMEKSYWHSKKGPSIFGPHEDYETLKKVNFEDAVKLFYKNQISLKHPGWKPQHTWICENNKIMINKAFRFEEIEQSVPFKAIFGKIEKLNSSNNKIKYQEYYNDKTRDLIQEIYKKDIEIFNYVF